VSPYSVVAERFAVHPQRGAAQTPKGGGVFQKMSSQPTLDGRVLW
jgi:hypothetical protein